MEYPNERDDDFIDYYYYDPWAPELVEEYCYVCGRLVFHCRFPPAQYLKTFREGTEKVVFLCGQTCTLNFLRTEEALEEISLTGL